MSKPKEKVLEIEVVTASQCSFIPFTVVPDSWKGKTVRVVLSGEETAFELESESLPWK